MVSSLKLGTQGEDVMTKKTGQQKAIDFERSLVELEGIVKKLEAGNQPLEKSLELFERGVELARLCKLKLDEAELRVQKLMKVREGLFREEPFEEDE